MRACRSTREVVKDTDVIIAGGGPVGLMLALQLAERGRSVALIEAEREPPRRSMAIGITPPSLDLLRELGLDHVFIQSGTPIREVSVHERGRLVGRLAFDEVLDRYPFILVLPQYMTVSLLRERAAEDARIQLIGGTTVIRIDSHPDCARVLARNSQSGEEQIRSASFVVACDGARGRIIEQLGIPKPGFRYAPGFRMGDFTDRTGLGNSAHLYFGPERPVESFPLPGGKRRWIVRSDWNARPDLAESLSNAVTRLTGHRVDASDMLDESWFQPARALARAFHRGRVALCGDAAHVMSPIGGQGMNTGFADAALLARALDEALAGRAAIEDGMRVYRAARVRAFRIASRRAAVGMRMGVLRGTTASAARGMLIGALLRNRTTHDYLARWFMMRSLPSVASDARVHIRPSESGRRHAFG